MSQDHLSNLLPNRAVEEVILPTPTAATAPQAAVAPLAPQVGLTDAGQSTLTLDRYWRLLTDLGLIPPGSAPRPKWSLPRPSLV
ncbi:hypothetical protein BHE74_00032702 [Ensete ventricosum]|nr:hypothetical protein BHE74_00032702 [Ensete ventricosum]